MAKARYQGPSDALALYEAAVAAAGLERKGAKNPYTSHNGHMFSFLDPDGVVSVRLDDDATVEFRSAYESGHSMQYGRIMRGYSTVPANLLADTETLADWIRRSHDWVDTLDPKQA